VENLAPTGVIPQTIQPVARHYNDYGILAPLLVTSLQPGTCKTLYFEKLNLHVSFWMIKISINKKQHTFHYHLVDTKTSKVTDMGKRLSLEF
jgi:hypothetical protein